jgi:phosphoribosylanthranilate isomerase
MAVAVKICGLSTHEALDVAIEAGADMLGFVFFPASPRHLSYAVARSLAERVRGRALKVALSVDATDDALAAMVEAVRPDYLQLHGSEAPQRVRSTRRRFGIPVMKALPIASPPISRAWRSMHPRPIGSSSMRGRRARPRARAGSATASIGICSKT